MPKQPAYFDSQASAAASLGIDIYEIREAKRAGCKAFRSGRVYPDKLLSWFESRRERARERQRDADSSDEMVSACDWKDRRSILFDVLEFLHSAYKDKRIGLVKYAELGPATVEQMIKLGEVWEAGIDAPGWRKTWKKCLRQAILQESQENKRSTRRN
jgi:hypothetical protein